MTGAESALAVVIGAAFGFVGGLFTGAVLLAWFHRIETRSRFDADIEAIIERQRGGR